MRSPYEFEHAPDGGASELSKYLGNFMDFPLGYTRFYIPPLVNKAGFYHLRSRDGTHLIEEPSRGIRGNYPFGDSWNNRYEFVKIQEPVGYPTSWRTVGKFFHVSRPVSFAGEAVGKLVMGVPRRFRWVTFQVSKEALRHSHVWGKPSPFSFHPIGLHFLTSCIAFSRERGEALGAEAVSNDAHWWMLTKGREPHHLFPGNVVRLSVSAIYDEHQKAKTRKRRPFYTPQPGLARDASLVNGLSSTSSTGAEAVSNDDPLVDAHRRLIGEVFFLCSQAQNMMARRDLVIQQVKASARWEIMKEWLEKRVEHWDPEEEYRRHLFLSGGINQQSESFSRVAASRSVMGLDNRILEIRQGPEDRLGTRRLQLGPERWALNPEVSSFLEYGHLEFGDRFRNREVFVRTRRSSNNPEVYLDHKIIFLGPRGRRGTRRFSFRSWDHDWSLEAVWEPGDSSIDPEIVSGPWCLYLDLEVMWEPGDRNLEVFPQILVSLIGTRRLYGNPEARLLPVPVRISHSATWKLATIEFYVVFYFCRKSLAGLEGAGVGVMTHVLGFAALQGPRCALRYTGVLGLKRIGGLWRPDPARMPL
ncbi:hypothetical protein F2Q70_00025901 [Brassica cretica]|uniref:Uncharacterized protein n=1 Tax=Brassica cretica TaxID=69181 RepID=A0A8S9L520_BRACR|nr:hypothetical protein F2Q70_00025901 [Brassica cretica]